MISEVKAVTFSSLQSVALVAGRRYLGVVPSLRNSEGTDFAGGSTVSPRSEILNLCVLAGDLCRDVLVHAPMDSRAEGTMTNNEEIRMSMGALLLGILYASRVACALDLRRCILKKIELNGRKYPVDLCKGKSGKYTNYSSETGITKEHGQSTLDPNDFDDHLVPDALNTSADSNSEVSSASSIPDRMTSSLSRNEVEALSCVENNDEEGPFTVHSVTALIRQFAVDRLWERYHTPRNLALALMGEMGELAELFQWLGDGDGTDGPCGSLDGLQTWSKEDRDKVGQEFADVTIYLMRLADVCGIDLGMAALSFASQEE